MIARPSRSPRARRATSDAPSPMPTPPIPPAPAPRLSGESTKIVSYPMVVVGIMLTAAVVLGILQLVKGKNDAPPVVAATTNAVPTADVSSDDAALIARVASLVSVNPNEMPTIATVQDPETLRSQNAAFYKEVEVGDRLLLWSDKAVLFSVKRNVILNAIVISAPPAAKDVSTENAVIEVRNGSSVAGMGRAAASRLATVGLSVLPAADANVKTYQKTLIVVPFEKAFPITVQKIREALDLNAEIVSSTEETGAKGDILVIIAPDFKR